MFLLLLFIGIFLAKPVLATGTLTITNTTGIIVTGDQFTISYSTAGLTSGDIYYIKAYGGVDPSTSQIYTINGSQQLASSTSWTNFPTLTIGDSGVSSGTINAVAPGISGTATLKLRLALVADTTKQVDANSSTINIITPTPTIVPTSTSTPTPIPTSTPLPTNTPSPTPSATNTPVPTSTLTLTPTPSNKPTTIPTATDAPWPTDTPLPELTPINDPLPSSIVGGPPVLTPTNAPSVLPTNTIGKSFASYLPTIFIVLGGILLLIPLILTKIKK